jgi:hypothetical protein
MAHAVSLHGLLPILATALSVIPVISVTVAIVNVAVIVMVMVMVIVTMRRSDLHNHLRISRLRHRCESKKHTQT